MYKNISLHIPSSCLCCRLWRQHRNTPGSLQDAFTAWNMLSIRHVKITHVSKIYLIFTVCTCFYVTVKAVAPAASSTTHCHCPVVLRSEHSRTIGAFLMRHSMVFNVGSISTSNSGCGLMWKHLSTFQPESDVSSNGITPRELNLKKLRQFYLNLHRGSTWGLLQWATCYQGYKLKFIMHVLYLSEIYKWCILDYLRFCPQALPLRNCLTHIAISSQGSGYILLLKPRGVCCTARVQMTHVIWD